MLKVSHLHWSVPHGGKKVLNDVSIVLPEHTMGGLIGPSGGGKSVLMKIIGGIYRQDAGRVHNGVKGKSDIGLMFQEGALFDSLNVFDNVAFPLVGGRVPSVNLPESILEDVREKVSEILARVGLTKAAFKFPGQLSGGMRRRVSLARALVGRPRLLLLDDPTSGLDPVASSVIMSLICELHQEYKPYTLMVSHDLRRLIPVVDYIFALFDGTIQFAGKINELEDCQYHHVQHFVSCRYDFVSACAES